ncbi:MAG: crossover junction endodeoxyribonuclease RuvC [Actinomycetota bacterium]
MFDSPVLGVDPGLASVGIAAVGLADRRPVLLEARHLATSASEPEAARLATIHAAVAEAIARHAPSSLAVERVAWNRNQGSALHVARATGVALLAAAQAGIPVVEYGPLEVKMAITGTGTAPKEQVRHALARLHGLRGVPEQPDAADAVAVALCHLTNARRRTPAVAR